MFLLNPTCLSKTCLPITMALPEPMTLPVSATHHLPFHPSLPTSPLRLSRHRSSSSFIFTPPRCSPTKALPTPIGAEQTGDESAFEEKPPFEEKHVTSTPYLGVGTLRDSIVKRFGTGSRLGSLLEMSCGDSFIDDTGMVSTCKSTFCVFFHWVKICNGHGMLSK